MFGRILGALSLLALTSCSQGMASTAAQESADRIEEARHSSDIVRFSKECEQWDEWDKSAKPFHIYGNTYYVGTCGIASILITNGENHAVIDAGTEVGADTIIANIQTLGFKLEDIWVLTNSHEHHDHVGGMAKLQKSAPSAWVMSSKIGLDVMKEGQVVETDPQSGIHDPMTPISDLRTEVVRWGESKFFLGLYGLQDVPTPGHSPGALSWQWESCQNDICKTIVYADSLSPVSRDDYKFSDHPDYISNYRAGIARLRALDCDILLTPHPSHSKMIERAATGSFEGGMTCVEYADSKTAALDARLAKEAEAE